MAPTFHILVFVSELFSFAQPYSVNYRCMVQLITQDSVIWGQQYLKKACIGIKTTDVKNGILSVVKFCDFMLKVFMNVLKRKLFLN